jgi:WD40 repeat protein
VTATTYALAFVPGTHRLLAGTSDGRVLAMDGPFRSGLTTVVDDVAEGVSALAVSSDARLLAVAGAADRLEVWRLDGLRASDRLTGRLPAGRALSVAFGPDHREVAAGTTGGEVRRWRIRDGRLAGAPTLTGFNSFVNGLAYTDDGRRLVAGSSDQTTAVYDLGSARQLSRMPGPAIVVSVDVIGTRIATASTDGTIRLWPRPDPTTHDARGPGWQLGVSTTSDLLVEATGRGDGSILLYDVDRPGPPVLRGKLVPPGGEGVISGTGALSRDGTLLAGGTTTGRIVLWGVDGGSTARLGVVRHRAGTDQGPASLVQALAISPDNHLLASVDATEAYTVIWNITNPMSPRRLPTVLPAGAIPLAVSFSADGRLLGVADAKNQVRVWDVADPARARQVALLGDFEDDANAVRFAPSGRLLAAASADRTLRLWNLDIPAQPRLVARLTGPEAPVYSVAFSSDGTRLAAGAGDGSLWLYDVSRPDAPVPVATLGAAGERVNDARFVDGDRRLVGVGPSGSLRFWQTDVQTAIDEICRRRGDAIDAREWNRYLAGIPARQIC